MVRRILRAFASLTVLSVLLLVPPAAPAWQGADLSSWVGKRVFTHPGTVLYIDGKAVDDEDRSKNLARGKDQAIVRVYKVKQVTNYWIEDENSGVKGWVTPDRLVPVEQAVEYYTNLIRADPSAAYYNSRGLAWKDRKEYDIAIADYNEAIRLDPGEAIYYYNRGLAWSDKKEYDKAIADYNEAIRLDPGGAAAYNDRAWLWATALDDKVRDGKRAVESATKACELNDWKTSNELDTLAASHAEAGDFAAAVKWQEKAIELLDAKDDDERADFGGRLELYRQGKPCRDATGS